MIIYIKIIYDDNLYNDNLSLSPSSSLHYHDVYCWKCSNILCIDLNVGMSVEFGEGAGCARGMYMHNNNVI